MNAPSKIYQVKINRVDVDTVFSTVFSIIECREVLISDSSSYPYTDICREILRYGGIFILTTNDIGFIYVSDTPNIKILAKDMKIDAYNKVMEHIKRKEMIDDYLTKL